MIEKKFIADKIKEFRIREFVKQNVGRVGLSDVKVQKTPLGEKIIISASRPGLVVGRAGSNIARMTKELKAEFKLENPQIEIEEIKQLGLDASIIGELIAGSMERYGSQRFKGIGYKAMTDVMNSGALGVEILMSGKIPSSRAKTWRFYKGYLKKCGDISIEGVQKAYSIAKLKTGVVGVKVSIMPSTVRLPDKIKLISEIQEVVEEVKESEAKEVEKDIKEKTESGEVSEVSKKKEQQKIKEDTQSNEVASTPKPKVSNKPKTEKKKTVKTAKKTEAKKTTKK